MPLARDSVISEFSIRIVKTAYGHIYVGIASLAALSQPSADHFMNKNAPPAIRFYKLANHKYLLASFKQNDVVRVVIDWKPEVVYWMVNDVLIRREKIQGLSSTVMYPCIEMETKNDIIEWIE